MTEKKKQSTSEQDFRKRMERMLRNADIKFMVGPPGMMPGEAQGTDNQTPEEDDRHADILEKIRDFSLKPKEVRDQLDRFVVSQSNAKKVLSVAICDHYNHVRQCIANPRLAEKDYAKQNVLLLGPTGVGKTYLIRCQIGRAHV